MGTTLTGTTPQDTYDSLIKVTDNGPLGATAKLLSDGLGNDSVLYLGTAGLGIKATSILSFNVNDSTHSVGYDSVIDGSQLRGQNGIRFSTGSGSGTERVRITSAGNVGIGIDSPSTKLTIDNSANAATRTIDLLGNSSTAKGHLGYFADNIYLSSNYFFESGQNNDTASLGQALIVVSASATNSNIQFATSAAGSTAPSIRASIDADGLKFGTDSAAANALDDYEEGTFTAILTPSTSGTITLNATYASFFYTKIGRQVMVSGTAIVNSVSSPVGNVRLEGLPFTSNVAVSNIQAANIAYYDNSATFIFAAAYMGNNVSRITTSIDASTVAAGDEIYFTHTYNV